MVVLGPEDHGLSARDLDHCPLRVTIPADPGYPSLNLAQSVQVLAYELRLAVLLPELRAGRAAAAAPVPATREQLEGFYGQLEQVLLRIGFLNPQNPYHMQTTLRRLVDRAMPEPREVHVLRGILSNIQRLLGPG